MGQEVALPDWARNGPAKGFAILNPADDNLADGIGQSYPVLSYRGKDWAIRLRGERHVLPHRHIDCVILSQAPVKSKSFFPKFEQGSDAPPLCSSINGETPDPGVPQPQAAACVMCPKNQWLTKPDGKKGKECTDYKRLAVVLMPDHTKNVPGGPIVEPVFLRVPPASLNALANMGETMSAQGFHYSTYVTRISFADEAHPRMVFTPMKGLDEAEVPFVLDMRKQPVVDRITKGDLVLPSSGVGTLLQHTLHSPPANTGAQAATQIIEQSAPVSSFVQPTSVSVPAPTPSASPPATVGAEVSGFAAFAPLVNQSGSGSLSGLTQTQQINTHASSPPPEQSIGLSQPMVHVEAVDDDLDARLAKLVMPAKQ